MKKLVVYIHGKGGNAGEAEHYKPIFKNCDVIGFDYKSQTPWEAKKEFTDFFNLHSADYDSVYVIANSIGAFFTMNADLNGKIKKAFFISPVVDMKRLILNMMTLSGVTEEKLSKSGEIATDFGETLSWKYLCYVRENSVKWNVPTCILYGEKDNLTSIDTITEFADKTKSKLTVMKDGEHWFHTDEQISFLDEWIKNSSAEEQM